MNTPHRAGPAKITARPDSFHVWRSRKDLLASKIIALGGLVVIAAVLLILFYLLYVVSPLFLPAKMSRANLEGDAAWLNNDTAFLALEEQQQVAFRIAGSGKVEFFSLDDMQLVESADVWAGGQAVAHVADDQDHSGLVAVAFEDGRVGLLQKYYSTDFSAGIELRKIVPKLDFPYGSDLRDLMPNGGITGLAMSDDESELMLAASGSGGRIRLERSTK
ncbi:MAG: hypothetical protein WBN41_10165, partial [Lysobacterales bacterium]